MKGERGHSDGFVLHRAPLVVPVSTPAIEDGAVLTCGGLIVKVGAFGQLKKEAKQVVDHEGAVLVPGMINCHTHLELSFLQELGQDNGFFAPGDITSWIYALLHKRVELSGDPERNFAHARQALEKMYQSGVVVNADIGNLGESSTISAKSLVQTFFFMEAFGLSETEIPEVEKRLAEYENLSWTGHALYSTHSELVQRLKKRARSRGDIFPIHTAESADELEFLQTGKGAFADFLGKRLGETNPQNTTRIDDIFIPPGKGAIAHLADLGCLDRKTLCVHCVHIDDFEIDLLASAGASVCLCPSSNKYLGVGKAPVAKLIGKGVKPCIGTDSLASNPRLNLWSEMKTLADLNPEVDAEDIFKMVTVNGADALCVGQSYGSLSVGKKAIMLAVKGVGTNKYGVYERLVHVGLSPEIDIVRGNNG